jgi:hypothetical protein
MMAWRISLCICNKTAKTLCATANKGMGTAANTNGAKDCRAWSTLATHGKSWICY